MGVIATDGPSLRPVRSPSYTADQIQDLARQFIAEKEMQYDSVSALAISLFVWWLKKQEAKDETRHV